MAAPDEIADELYGASFDEFIALRDARVRELRKEKRREEADAVKALRKPALSAWGLDQLGRRDRDVLDELLAAGAALRQAKGGDTLRDATREERGAVARAAERTAELLREAGHSVTEKTAGEIRDTLHAAALDDETRELLIRGRLTEPRQAIGLGGGFGLGVPAREPDDEPAEPPKPAKEAKKGKAKPKEDAAARRKRDEAEARKAAKERAKAARKALRDAEAELQERERAVASAERDLRDAERAAEEARAEVERLRAESEA